MCFQFSRLKCKKSVILCGIIEATKLILSFVFILCKCYHCLAQMLVAVNDEHMSAKAAVASSLLMGASLSDNLLDGRQWSQTLQNLMNNNDDPTVSSLLTSIL